MKYKSIPVVCARLSTIPVSPDVSTGGGTEVNKFEQASNDGCQV